jgi:hypothetical protein
MGNPNLPRKHPPLRAAFMHWSASLATAQSRMFWSKGTTASYSLKRPDKPLLEIVTGVRRGSGFIDLRL